MDIEKAARYYEKAIQLGAHFLKIDLDRVFDQTVIYKAQNPNYKKIEIKEEEYYKQKMRIIL